MLLSAVCALLTALLVVGCGVTPPKAPPVRAKPAPPPLRDDVKERIMTTEVTSTATAAPIRFTAPLAINEQELNGGAPPFSFVNERLCLGDPEIQRRFEAAFTRAGDDNDEAVEVLTEYARHCDGPGSCTWALQHITNDIATARQVALSTLRSCPAVYHNQALQRLDPETFPLGELSEWLDPRLEVHPALERLLERALKEQPDSVAPIATTLANTGDPRALETLVRLRAAAIGRQARRNIDDALVAALAPPPSCGTFSDCNGELAQEPGSKIGRWCENAVTLHDASPGSNQSEQIVEQVVRRTRAAFDDHSLQWTALQCFGAWARLDWRSARAFAQSQYERIVERQWEHTPVLRTVTRFESREALVTALADVGLLPSSVAEGRGVTPFEVLVDAGRGLHHGEDSGDVPIGYDALLFRLARTAAPWLDDALFQELPPDEEKGEQGDAYTLNAYFSGKRFSTRTDDGTGTYDIQALYGLTNALLEQSGSPLRAIWLSREGEVIIAEPRAFQRAVEAGLFLMHPREPLAPPATERAPLALRYEKRREALVKFVQAQLRRPLLKTETVGSCTYRGSLQIVGPLQSPTGTLLGEQHTTQPIEATLRLGHGKRPPMRTEITWPITANVTLQADSAPFQLEARHELMPGVYADAGARVWVQRRQGNRVLVRGAWNTDEWGQSQPAPPELWVECEDLTLHDQDEGVRFMLTYADTIFVTPGELVLRSAPDGPTLVTLDLKSPLPITVALGELSPGTQWFEVQLAHPFSVEGWLPRSAMSRFQGESYSSIDISRSLKASLVTHVATRSTGLRLQPEPDAQIVARLVPGARFERGATRGDLVQIHIPEIQREGDPGFYITAEDFSTSEQLTLDDLRAAIPVW